MQQRVKNILACECKFDMDYVWKAKLIYVVAIWNITRCSVLCMHSEVAILLFKKCVCIWDS